MQIRKMTPGDYEQAYELWLESGNGLNDIDDSKSGIEKHLKRNPNTCFVAEENGKIIGAIMSGHDGRRGFIGHTAVIASERKRGIGTALANKAIEALKAEGITKVALLVFIDNGTGNKFWEKLGFNTRSDVIYRDKPLIETKRINDGFKF
ncbi:MAG: GNAT family N-acetyltransferase [Oscillospiraceae bacterium]|nr:GNAT family N-acetyltransferase [Oscillospiraceae bacterium]